MFRYTIDDQSFLVPSAVHALIHPLAMDAGAGSEMRDAHGVVIAVKEPRSIEGSAFAFWQPTLAWPKAHAIPAPLRGLNDLLGLPDAEEPPSAVLAVAPVAPTHAVSKHR